MAVSSCRARRNSISRRRPGASARASSRRRFASSASRSRRLLVCFTRRRVSMALAPCSREAGAQLAFSSPIAATGLAVTRKSYAGFGGESVSFGTLPEHECARLLRRLTPFEPLAHFAKPSRAMAPGDLLRRPPRSGRKLQVQKLVEGARPVIAKGLAVHEAIFAVQRQRRLERRAASGLQTEAGQSARFRLTRDVIQQQRRHAAAQMIGMGAHRLHLGAAVAQLLQRADADDLLAVADRPDGDA